MCQLRVFFLDEDFELITLIGLTFHTFFNWLFIFAFDAFILLHWIVKLLRFPIIICLFLYAQTWLAHLIWLFLLRTLLGNWFILLFDFIKCRFSLQTLLSYWILFTLLLTLLRFRFHDFNTLLIQQYFRFFA